jgi:hypothetical protein
MDWTWRPITWPPHFPDLTLLDFFLWGYMQNLVYETPVETQHELMTKIAVVAATIREMPGIFQRVRYNIVRQCRTCSEVSSCHSEQLLHCETTIISPETYASSQKLLWSLVPKGSFCRHGCIDKIWSDWSHLPQSVVAYIYLHRTHMGWA